MWRIVFNIHRKWSCYGLTVDDERMCQERPVHIDDDRLNLRLHYGEVCMRSIALFAFIFIDGRRVGKYVSLYLFMYVFVYEPTMRTLIFRL